MDAVLQQADQPQLGECAGAAPDPGRPKPAALAALSATSRGLPSRLTSRQSRYHAPRVAIGRTNRSYSCRSGSSPSRLQAWEMALLPATLTAAGPQIARSPSSRQRSTSRRLDPM
jgi:hypothetical protein